MSDYWQKRQKELYSAMEKDEAKLKERLSKYYDSEYRRLDKEIAAYYTKYGTDNVIEYRNLMERLSDSDRRLLFERMNDFTAKYPQYAHLLPVRESIYNLNRLEGLQYSIRLTQLDIGAVDIAQITDYLDKQALRGLNWGKEMLGYGKNFYANDSDITKLFVNVPWSGEDFSTRIWNDTSKLAGYLSQDFAQGIARGESYDRLTAQLQKRFGDVNRRDAYRLVFTEGTYVMAESSMHPFTDDFEYYTISALPDACDICTDIADNTLPFKISDRAAGADFPPFHPWCRCTFEIYVDDWDKWMDDYVERHGGNAEQAEKIYNALSPDTPAFMRTETYQAMNLSQKEYIKSEMQNIPASHRTLARGAINDIIFIDEGQSGFDKRTGILYVLKNPEKAELTHEVGHALEEVLGVWKDKEFLNIVEDITNNVKPGEFKTIIAIDGRKIDVVLSDRFISEYQGSIFDLNTAIDRNGIKPRRMWEYFSEGYREYITNENNLKAKDIALYNYFIKRLPK